MCILLWVLYRFDAILFSIGQFYDHYIADLDKLLSIVTTGTLLLN